MRIYDLDNLEDVNILRGSKLKKAFIELFKKNYDAIAVYHATRLDRKEVLEVKKNGLVCNTADMMKRKAKERFIISSDKKKTNIDAEIDLYFSSVASITINKLYVCLSKRQLSEGSYQYLLLGPESLVPLADILEKKFNLSFKKRMTEYGNPYIISAIIQTDEITEKDFDCLHYCIRNDVKDCCLTLIGKNLEANSLTEIKKIKRKINNK